MKRKKDWEKRIRREALDDFREEMREEAEGIRAMLARELSGDSTRDTGHIDHTPGGSPNPYPPAAPAPDHTYRTPDRFTPRKARTPSDRISFAELIARANRATRQAMRGKQWSDADRQDAASHAIEAVIRKATDREGPRMDLPAELASGVGLYRLAKDAREAKRASADRDHADLIRKAFTDDATHPDPGSQLRVERDVCRYPYQALIAAWEMLADLGLPSTGQPFIVAYTAARMTVLDSYADVAAELGMTRAAHKKAISRVSSSIPAASKDYRSPVRVMTDGSLKEVPAAFLDALHSLNRPDAGSSRAGAAKLERDWRTMPGAPAKVRRSRCRKYCRRTPADWVLALPSRSRHALHAASSARQERMNIPTRDRCKV